MKNLELKAMVEAIVKSKAVEGARVTITQHGNGYYVCVQAPHTVYSANGKSHTECSLPKGFWAWGIQGADKVRKIANAFFDDNDYLTR